MRCLVFGGGGMLGRAVATHWRRQGGSVLALDRARADIRQPAKLNAWADRFKPQVIVNCAAFTRVDDCEAEEQLATEINGTSVRHVVAAARSVDAALVHISSDYVFAGQADSGQNDTPIPIDAPTGPRSAYGRGKLVGEQHALAYERSLVLRASWLFGPGGPNFANTIRRLLLTGKSPLPVVNDQIGRPTYTPFVARAIWDLVHVEARGLVHYGNRDAVSWYDFACEIARQVKPSAEVEPVTTKAFPRPAPRPAYSVLDVSGFEQLTGRTVEPWIQGLCEYLDSPSP